MSSVLHSSFLLFLLSPTNLGFLGRIAPTFMYIPFSIAGGALNVNDSFLGSFSPGSRNYSFLVCPVLVDYFQIETKAF